MDTPVFRGNILLVDDDFLHLELLSNILSDLDCEINVAISGKLAFQLIAKKTPDLILLDIKMPVMNGFEFYKILKKDIKTKEIPVIFVSSNNDTDDKIRAFQMGAVDYISKPFHAEEVQTRVSSHMRNSLITKELEYKNKRLKSSYTALKMAQNEQKILGEIIEDSLNEVYIFDSNSLFFLKVNQGGEKNTGYSEKELLQMTLPNIAPELSDEILRELFKPLHRRKKKKIVFRSIFLRKDGSTYPVEVHLQLIKKDNFFLAIVIDISEQQKKEQELKRNRKKIANILHTAPVGIGLSKNRIILEVNNQFCKITGYNSAELIGRSTRFLYPSEKEYNHVDNEEYIEKFKQKRITIETHWKRKTGEIIDVQLSSSPFEKDVGLIFTVLDISKEKQAEQKLKASEEKYRYLIQNAPTGIISTDIEGRVTNINSKMLEILGFLSYKTNMRINVFKFPLLQKSGITASIEHVIRTQKSFQSDHEYISRRGKKSFLHVIFNPIWNSSLQLTGVQANVEDVSKQKLAEQKLIRSEQDFRDMFENSLVGIFQTTLGGKILKANRALCNMLAYKNPNELLTELKSPDIHANKKDREILMKQLQKTGYVKGFECKWKRKDGRIIYIRENVKQFINDAGETIYESIVENITAQKIAEKEKQQAETEFLKLIESINIPIIIINQQGRVTNSNEMAKQVTGYSSEEMQGEIFTQRLMQKNKTDELKKMIKKIIKGKEVTNFKFNFYNKNGDELKTLMSTSPRFDLNGNVIETICMWQDISKMERHKVYLEHEIKIRTKKLVAALEKEKELNLLKSRFVSTASHEFRTPLSTINFAAGFVKKYWHKIDEEGRKKKLEKIEMQVKHMTMLLDDVLTFGKIEARKMKLQLESFNVNDFFEPIIEEVYAHSKGSHAIKQIGFPQDATICIDEKIGRNIFINLLTNAIKFSPDNKLIELIYQKTEKETIISVRDFGMGIKQSDLKNIFEPFNRGSNVDTIQGTGLGLAIVNESLKQLGGRIELKSEFKKGSTFKIFLPVEFT